MSSDAKKTTLILCASIYHLFVALMIIYSRDLSDKVFLLLTTHEKAQYDVFLKIQPKLERLGIPFEIRLRNKKRELLGIEAIKSKQQIKRVFNLIGSEDFHFINFSWNFSGPFRTSASWYKACNSAEFFEEGAMCNATPQDKKWKKTIKSFLGIRGDFYKDNKLESINVQKPELFPKEYSEKIKTLNLELTAKSLTRENQYKILSVFLDDNEIESIRQICSDNLIVLFTQPLSEDGYIDENHKVQLYTTIYDYLSQRGRVVVKLHPRDKTNYYFTNSAILLGSDYPSELLLLFPVEFALAIGICTSAVISCKAKKSINLSKDYLKILDESFLKKLDKIIEADCL